MAISYINSATASATTVTIPTVAVGDLMLIFAHRTTTTAPTLPTGWTNVANTSGNSNSMRVGYKFATSTSETSGTWTNATLLEVVIYRNVASIGASTCTSTATGTSANVPALTLTKTDGTSWVAGNISTNQTTSISTPTGTSLRATKTGTSDMAISVDSNGGVTSWAAHSATLGSSGVHTQAAVELLAANFSPSTPTLLGPSNGSTASTTTPTLSFTTTDPDGDDVSYEVQVDTVSSFDSTGTASHVIDQYPTSNDNGLQTTMGVGSASGMSFTGDGSVLGSVQAYLDDNTSASGTVTAQIFAHTGTFGSTGIPTGSALATSDAIATSTIPSGASATLITFTFTGTNQITLANGTHYVIVVNGPSAAGLIGWNGQNISPSAPGNASHLSGTWSATTAFDLIFYINSTSSAAPILDTVSATDPGFTDTSNGADTDPFASGDSVSYTVQSALASGTYYWRVRAIDPSGTDAYSTWATTQSFTVSSGLSISLTGIPSTTSLGAPAVSPGTATVSPTGEASTLTLGNPTVSQGSVNISSTGITSTLSIGAPTVSAGPATISPTGIASTLSIGSPTTSETVTFSVTGIGSTLSLGAPTVIPTTPLSPTGITSSLSIGSPTVAPGTVTIGVTGKASSLTIGTVSVSPGPVSRTITGIATTLTLGSPTLGSSYTLSVSPITSNLTLGSPVLSAGPVTITTSGISSSLTIGHPAVSVPGLVTPTGIASSLSLGAPNVAPGTISRSITGIPSTLLIGSPSIAPGVVIISPTGISSSLVFGVPTVAVRLTIAPSGIASGLTLGAVYLVEIRIFTEDLLIQDISDAIVLADAFDSVTIQDIYDVVEITDASDALTVQEGSDGTSVSSSSDSIVIADVEDSIVIP